MSLLEDKKGHCRKVLVAGAIYSVLACFGPEATAQSSSRGTEGGPSKHIAFRYLRGEDVIGDEEIRLVGNDGSLFEGILRPRQLGNPDHLRPRSTTYEFEAGRLRSLQSECRTLGGSHVAKIYSDGSGWIQFSPTKNFKQRRIDPRPLAWDAFLRLDDVLGLWIYRSRFLLADQSDRLFAHDPLVGTTVPLRWKRLPDGWLESATMTEPLRRICISASSQVLILWLLDDDSIARVDWPESNIAAINVTCLLGQFLTHARNDRSDTSYERQVTGKLRNWTIRIHRSDQAHSNGSLVFVSDQLSRLDSLSSSSSKRLPDTFDLWSRELQGTGFDCFLVAMISDLDAPPHPVVMPQTRAESLEDCLEALKSSMLIRNSRVFLFGIGDGAQAVARFGTSAEIAGIVLLSPYWGDPFEVAVHRATLQLNRDGMPLAAIDARVREIRAVLIENSPRAAGDAEDVLMLRDWKELLSEWRSSMREPSLETLLSKAQLPVLILHGRADVEVPLRQEDITSVFANGLKWKWKVQMHEVDHAGLVPITGDLSDIFLDDRSVSPDALQAVRAFILGMDK